MIKQRHFVVAGILFVWVFVVILSRTRTEPGMLQRAEVVATFDNDALFAGSQGRGILTDGYEWIDDHRLIRYVCPTHNRGNGSPYIQDIKSGMLKPFTVPPALARGEIVSVSPDGKWLLWNDDPGLQGNPVATSFDGRTMIKWKRPLTTRGMTWMPDSSRWIVVSVPTASPSSLFGCLAIGSLQDTKPREIPLPGISAYAGVAGFLGPNQVLVRDHFDPRFSARGFPDEVPRLLHVVDVSASSKPEPPVDVRVPDVPGALVSPHADRILWWYRSFHRGPIDRLKQRLMHEGASSVTVYVTDLHGGHLQNIGTLDEGPNFMTAFPKWCPDGKHVSFAWGDKLYRLAV